MDSLLKSRELEISELQHQLQTQNQNFLEVKKHHNVALIDIEKQCNDAIKNLISENEALQSENEVLKSENKALSSTLEENQKDYTITVNNWAREHEQAKETCEDLQKRLAIAIKEKDDVTKTLRRSHEKMLEAAMVKCQKERQIEKDNLVLHYNKSITELQTTNEKISTDLKKQSQLMRKKERKATQLLQASNKQAEDAITVLAQLKRQYDLLEHEKANLENKTAALQNNIIIAEKQAANDIDNLKQQLQNDRVIAIHNQAELDSSLSRHQMKIDELLQMLSMCCQPGDKAYRMQSRTVHVLSNSPPSLFSLAIKKIEHTQLYKPCEELVKSKHPLIVLNVNDKSRTSFMLYIVCLMVVYLLFVFQHLLQSYTFTITG